MSAKTRGIYEPLVRKLQQNQKLAASASSDVVDRALDRELVQLFLNGTGLADARHLYYATRWSYTLTNETLRLSNASLRGFGHETRTHLEDPITWESVVLSALAALRSPAVKASSAERVAIAAAMLLGFDLFARGGDCTTLLRSELRPPAPRQQGIAALWSMTFHPREADRPSKTGTFDVAKAVAGTNATRAWLTSICPLVLRLPHRGPSLFGLGAQRYLALFHASRLAAAVDDAHPHQQRHGGASADAMSGATDLALLDRGPWSSTKSIQRYRRPARYIRKLALLTPEQTTLAGEAPQLIPKLMKDLLI